MLSRIYFLLTKTAQAVIFEELEQMIQLTVDSTQCDYGMFIGNQIHTLEGRDFVWPGPTYAVKGENRLADGG